MTSHPCISHQLKRNRPMVAIHRRLITPKLHISHHKEGNRRIMVARRSWIPSHSDARFLFGLLGLQRLV
ncbi:hypothetical protein Hanom_Chr04g00293591 [Helianthus anomalus]